MEANSVYAAFPATTVGGTRTLVGASDVLGAAVGETVRGVEGELTVAERAYPPTVTLAAIADGSAEAHEVTLTSDGRRVIAERHEGPERGEPVRFERHTGAGLVARGFVDSVSRRVTELEQERCPA